MLVKMKMPCDVSYLPPKCRKPRESQVWKPAEVSIASPDVSEAPPAFRVETRTGEQATPTFYEIRSFDGRLWWPLHNRAGTPMDVALFMEGLAAGRHESLYILNSSWQFFSGHQLPYKDLMARIGYRFVHDESDAAYAEAQQGAAQIMFCGDVVHAVGGPPVFFGCRAFGSTDGVISVRIGRLQQVSRLPVVGPHGTECYFAQQNGLVFDAATLDSDLALLRSKGHPIGLVEKLETFESELAVNDEALRASADGVVRRLFELSMDLLPYYRDFVPAASLETTELLPLETCRDLLIDVVERTWPRDRELAAVLSWAAMVEQRLRRIPRPPLSSDDDDALGSLGP